jgi:acyl carrier protein
MNGKRITRAKDRARHLLQNSLGVSADGLVDGASIDSLLEWTSLSHVYVINEMEKTLDRKLDVDEILSATSLENITEILLNESTTSPSLLD